MERLEEIYSVPIFGFTYNNNNNKLLLLLLLSLLLLLLLYEYINIDKNMEDIELVYGNDVIICFFISLNGSSRLVIDSMICSCRQTN